MTAAVNCCVWPGAMVAWSGSMLTAATTPVSMRNFDGERAPVDESDVLAGVHVLDLAAVRHRLHVGVPEEDVGSGEHGDAVVGAPRQVVLIHMPVDDVMPAVGTDPDRRKRWNLPS